MRQIIKNLVGICAQILPCEEPIYEFGSYQVEGQVGFADLRPYFPGKTYVGCDMRPGTGVDLILDLHQIALPDETAGMVLSLDTLEHVEDPRLALTEIHRILKPNGIVIISSVMNFGIHDYPADYWRFTPEGFASILKPFDTVITDYAGEALFPHTVVGIGIKGSAVPEPVVAQLRHALAMWRENSYHQH
ncbi:class I SAM-dependent methyltransferase [Paenibacillus dendritiformis]|uniref:Type 11 methyltransferase n=1 Tax=Paenibacillus dendritiformis C454 TaxID=1131935 RepID=H3SAY3_9BACL|nr:class I SAM-dependent methyltransferase [Paenibacillus dendritiformis]EHQ63716.1 type 11 methyltransferase [Paenibacillus dendritiformis C454]CAH8772520.1 class I SAM-dependent methyltransferase [Paenibacillus dendritiformis]